MKASMQEEKSQLMAYCLWGLGIVGINGMHSLYLGQYKRGTLLLVTLGGLGIFQLIDLFSLALEVNKCNGNENLDIGQREKKQVMRYSDERKNTSNNEVLQDNSLDQLEEEHAELQRKLRNFRD